MDKIKNILSPGHSKDDELMYGSESAGQSSGATGKVTGQGSHFASDDPVSAPGHTQDSQLASNTGSTEQPYGATGKVSGAGSHFASNDPVSANDSSRATATDTTSTGPATTTTGPHGSNTLNKADPRVDSNASQSNTGNSPFAAKAAGTAWSSQNKTTPGAFPEDDTSNPYAASQIDPRVDSTPRTQTSAQTGAPTSTTGQSSLGTSDPSSRYDESGLSGRTSGPGQSTTQALDPSSRSEQYGNTTGSRGYGDSPSQTTGTTTSTADTTDDTGKKSKIATVLGAVGLGGAAAKEKHDESRSTGTTHSPSATTGTDSYTSPTQSGQGISHRRKESIPTTAYPSGTLDSPRAVAPPVGGGSTEHATTGSYQPSNTDDTGKATIGQTSTYGSHYLGSGEPTSSIVDPNSSDPNTYRKPETSHLGRDAAIGTGIGAAGLAAGSHGHHHDQLEDQRATHTGTTGTSNTASFHDAVTAPTSQSGPGRSTYDAPTASRGAEHTTGHHTGRDAALAGGAAGLGAGAYEAERHSGPTSSTYTDPSSSTTGTGAYDSGRPSGTSSSTYTDPSLTHGTAHSGSHHVGRDAALAGTAGGLGAGAYEADKHSRAADPSTTQGSGYPSGHHGTHESGYPSGSTSSRYEDPNASRGVDSTRDHHHHHAGRDAALAGTVGGVGAGAYEADRHSHAADPSTTQGSGYPSGTSSSRYDDPNTSRGIDSTRDHHTGRDAALAGAGAGVGAHELSKHDAEKAEKERLKEAEKQQKAHDKAVAKEEKQHEKALEKEQKREHKHHEKELAKEEKREHKQYEKEVAKEEKQEEKAEKKHEKELAKEEKREEKAERKHEKELAKEEKHHHHGKEEAAGAAGATALGAHEYDQHHDNELGNEDEEKSKKPSLIQRILHPRKSKAAAEEAEEPTTGLAAADAADRRAYSTHGDAASRDNHLTGVHDRTGESAAVGGAGAAGLAHEERGLQQGEGYGTTGTGTSGLGQEQYGREGYGTTGAGTSGLGQEQYGREGYGTTGAGTSGLAQGESGREGYGTTGGNYSDARDKTGTGQYNDGLTGSTGTGTGAGTSALGSGETGQAGQGLTRESMTGQPSDHTFGEITDHRR